MQILQPDLRLTRGAGRLRRTQAERNPGRSWIVDHRDDVVGAVIRFVISPASGRDVVEERAWCGRRLLPTVIAGRAQLHWTVRRGTVTVVGVTLRLWRARDRRRRGYERVREIPSTARKGGVGGALEVFLTGEDNGSADVRLRHDASEHNGDFARDAEHRAIVTG